MKTYPYQTPDGIIELVEKQELDRMTFLAHDLASQVADFGALVDELAMLRAEDMATIKELKDALKSEKSTRNHRSVNLMPKSKNVPTSARWSMS